MKFNNSLFKKIFSISDIDSHYVIVIFTIQIRIKHKSRFDFVEVNKYGLNKEERNPKIVVSLTSFPKRINSVYKTISTLLNQTMKPDVVVLWLSESQFEGKKLPQNLVNLEKYGLTIKWCDDIKSYKKLIPSLKEYPDDIIITVDDDIYYKNDTVETLYKEYLKDKNNIYAHRVSIIKYKNGELTDSRTNDLYWADLSKAKFAHSMIGCGGVLYPPHSLYKDVLDEEIFKSILTQDDIWFFAMAILNKTKIQGVKNYKESIITVEDTQQFGLCKINENHLPGLSRNEALSIITKKYPELIKIIKEENE